MMTLVRTNRRPVSVNADLFGGVFDQIFNDSYRASEANTIRPKANVEETDTQIVLELAVPGFDKNDVTIKIENDILHIEGKKEEEDDRKFSRQEFRVNRFNRQFTLSEIIDTESVSANFLNGVLTITLPKVEAQQPKSITVPVE